MKLRVTSGAFAALLLAGGAHAGIPVHIGGDDMGDACGGLGHAAGAGNNGSIAVRTGPGEVFRIKGRLLASHVVHICEERRSWLGVVYGAEGVACGVDAARPHRAIYVGPCRWGWVPRRNIALLAG